VKGNCNSKIIPVALFCVLNVAVTGREVPMSGKGEHCPWRRKVPKMSQVFYSMQYIFSRKIFGSNIANLFLAKGAI